MIINCPTVTAAGTPLPRQPGARHGACQRRPRSPAIALIVTTMTVTVSMRIRLIAPSSAVVSRYPVTRGLIIFDEPFALTLAGIPGRSQNVRH